ncbi:hypothetical protein [Telluribacter sp.]|uniref:hypothetical protein n=1 Tax=Telluribacter sp. TaxID=1978767 RepID=UPI002E13242F|nr:hypothetical protein [Telluribacter sp.]
MVLLVSVLLACETKEGPSQGNSLETEYLGTWERIAKADRGLTIYEKGGGLFMQYRNGSTYPLKYEEEGSYYYAVTPVGNVPLLLDKGIIVVKAQ